MSRKPRKDTATTRHIKARVTDQEFRQVLKDAKKADKTMADFIREKVGL